MLGIKKKIMLTFQNIFKFSKIITIKNQMKLNFSTIKAYKTKDIAKMFNQFLTEVNNYSLEAQIGKKLMTNIKQDSS